ncbi:CaiB/BaiF CoA transferase family protein [Modestobacter versicolor]|uniref:CaiB/BaiF CoA transferase family protein n=1 Tax=Modestobacter versicolor TaxID=429133 RepID=UPI0034DEE5E1
MTHGSETRADRRPMAGLRVLDLTSNVAGPLAGQVMADLGAEVIKVEPPEGEAGRRIRSTIPGQEELMPYFLPHHRGKKSVVVDLRTSEGVETLRTLTATADVFMQGFRPGYLDRLGLGADALRTVNPRLIYASLSAYSGTGTQRQRPGIDALIQSEAGLLTGLVGEEGRPLLPAPTFVDASSGHALAQGVLAALLARERFGHGDTVDVALYDVAISLQAPFVTRQLNTAPEHAHLTADGRGSVAVTPSGAFRAKDGYLMLFAYVPKHWALLVEALDRADLATDPRFIDQFHRTRHRGELTEELEASLGQRTVAEWSRLLTSLGVMASPPLTWADVVTSDAFREAELAIAVDSDHGEQTAVRMPVRYASFTPGGGGHVPAVGEHTEQVLGTLPLRAGSAS